MGRYANSVIRHEFPDLSEDDDLIYITIRNPKTLPIESLVPGDVRLDEAGNPVLDEARDATYQMMAGLIIDWHVYDGTIDDDSDPLPLPATSAMVKTLPAEILTWLADEVGKVTATPQ